MKNQLRTLALVPMIVPAFYSQGVNASTFYANTEYGYASTQFDLEMDGENINISSSQSMTEITLGLQTDRNLSFELRAATSVADHDITASSGDVTVGINDQGVGFGLDNYYGAYIKYDIAVSDTLKLHASAGYTQFNFSFSDDNQSSTETVSDDDVSFGIGGSIYITRKMALEVDFARMFSKEAESSDLTMDVDTVNLGLKFWL